MSTGLMQGKRGLIMGLANDKSIAWGIAQAVAAQGADLAFSYQGEALKKRVEPLAASLGTPRLFECDVASDDSIDALFQALQAEWGQLDFLVHAIGFADKNELRGRYIDTSRAGFALAMDISVFSFTAVCQRAAAMMGPGGSLLTLTYYGAEKVMPHYNVMGVAKAGLEASVKYLAEDLGKRDLRRADQDSGRQRDRRFSLHHEMERTEQPAAPECHAGGGWQGRALPAVGPWQRHHGREPACRCGLSCGGDEGDRSARYRPAGQQEGRRAVIGGMA
jgi:enoyl-[acyl-carrier-protein] reductase (NADH)